MFSSIEEDTKQFPGALRVTVEVGECKQHSEDRLPLVVEIWLNHKTQKEPQLGQGTAGLQMVERWQVIRLSPSDESFLKTIGVCVFSDVVRIEITSSINTIQILLPTLQDGRIQERHRRLEACCRAR